MFAFEKAPVDAISRGFRRSIATPRVSEALCKVRRALNDIDVHSLDGT